MSNLRNQLDKAAAEYHAASYPGDLASEVIRFGIGISPSQIPAGPIQPGVAPVTRQRWWWAGTGSAAAAAVLAVGFYISQGQRSNQSPAGPAFVPITFNNSSAVPGGNIVPADFNLNRGMRVAPYNNRFQFGRPQGPILVDTPAPGAQFRNGQDLSIQPNLSNLKNLDYTEPTPAGTH